MTNPTLWDQHTNQPEQHDRAAEHFSRFWPVEPGVAADAPLFLLAVSPLRALALAVLWATSSPGRAVVGLAVLAVLTAVVLIVL